MSMYLDMFKNQQNITISKDNFLDILNNHINNLNVPSQLKFIIRYVVLSKFNKDKVNNYMKKMLSRLFDTVEFAEYFRRIKFSKISHIQFSNRYIVLTYIAPSNWFDSGVLNHYVIGLMDNNKLFIHKVEHGGVVEYKDDGTIRLMQSDDSKMLSTIKDLFLYATDCELEECGVCIHGRHRVQGDVMFNVNSLTLDRIIYDQIYYQLSLMVRDYIARQIVNIFIKYNVSARLTIIDGEPAVIIEVPKVSITTKAKLFKIITKLLIESLNLEYFTNNKLHIKGDVDWYNNDSITISDSTLCATCWDVEIKIDYRQIYYTNSANFIIRPYVKADEFNVFHKVMEYAVAEYEKLYGEYEYEYGRHKIKYQGYPNVFTFTYNDPILGNLQFNITLPENTIVVKGQLLITHPEHKPFFYMFNIVHYITVESIRNDAEYRLNLHRLMHLANKGDKQ